MRMDLAWKPYLYVLFCFTNLLVWFVKSRFHHVNVVHAV